MSRTSDDSWLKAVIHDQGRDTTISVYYSGHFPSSRPSDTHEEVQSNLAHGAMALRYDSTTVILSLATAHRFKRVGPAYQGLAYAFLIHRVSVSSYMRCHDIV